MWKQKFLQRPLAAVLLIGLAAAAPGQRQTVKLETLPAEEFQKLPGNATVQFQGRSMTKDQFLAEVRQKQSRSASGPRADADPAKEFEQKERARIAAKNSSIRASRPASGISAEKGAEACNSPRIYSLEAAPPLEPGQRLRITGCGFGSRGSVKLFGVFSGGSLDLDGVATSDCSWCDSWESHSILVDVPYVSGVNDQNLVQLQVKSGSGEKSNLWQTSFRAARVSARLPFSDLQVTCAKPGPGTVCKSTWAPMPPGAFGQHGNPGLSFGTDSYAVSLINNWEVHSFFVEDHTQPSILEPSCLGFAVKGGSQLGASAQVDIGWLEYTNDCPARYLLLVNATGPKGLPYK